MSPLRVQEALIVFLGAETPITGGLMTGAQGKPPEEVSLKQKPSILTKNQWVQSPRGWARPHLWGEVDEEKGHN